jgi:hypothetical protein
MLITLSPIRAAAPIDVERRGEVLVIDGAAHDLSSYSEGSCPWILGQPRLAKGIWQVTLMLPHGGSAPPETLFPKPVRATGDGPVVLPPFDTQSRPEGVGGIEMAGDDPDDARP